MNLRQYVMGGLLLTQYLEGTVPDKIDRATKERCFSCEQRFKVCEYENDRLLVMHRRGDSKKTAQR